MSRIYRGKEIFKPLNTGRIDERVSCVREFVANIFFYTKNGVTIMIDAGYNYDRLEEKMRWLGLDPAAIHHILITHQDTDHVARWRRTATDCSAAPPFTSGRRKTATSLGKSAAG